MCERRCRHWWWTVVRFARAFVAHYRCIFRQLDIAERGVVVVWSDIYSDGIICIWKSRNYVMDVDGF